MKINRAAVLIFTVSNCILAIVCAVFFFRADRIKPEFTASASEVVYTEDMDESRLLEGLSARDNRDGDVTGRIVIEKIMENKEEGTAVVFYAVSDQSGNAAKFSRQFPAVYADNKNQEPGTAGYEAVFGDAGSIQTADEEEKLESEPDEGGEGEGAPAAEQAESPLPEPTLQPAPGPTPTARPTAPPQEQPAEEPAEEQPSQQAEAEPEEEKEEPDGSQPPVITLQTREVHVKAGVRPAWVDVIGVLSDDKDDYGTLFGNLKVSKYDVNTPGTYQVTVSTEDSNGNASAALPLTIVVQ